MGMSLWYAYRAIYAYQPETIQPMLFLIGLTQQQLSCYLFRILIYQQTSQLFHGVVEKLEVAELI